MGEESFRSETSVNLVLQTWEHSNSISEKHFLMIKPFAQILKSSLLFMISIAFDFFKSAIT